MILQNRSADMSLSFTADVFKIIIIITLLIGLGFFLSPEVIFAAQGDYVWAKKVGGTGADLEYSIAIDSNGYSYVTGLFTGATDFDPSSGTAELTSTDGTEDVFILKLDTDGNYVWAKKVGGTGTDVGYSMKVDSSGNSYSTGLFSDTTDFDSGAGTANLISAGNEDIFILKLDTNGDYVWAKKVGGAGTDIGYSITIDSSGNSYVVGQFTGTADFDPGAGTANLISAGSEEVFILKLDTDGNYVWAKKVGGAGNDIANSIKLDSNSNLYITGYFNDTADFDPGAGTANLVSTSGSNDVFILKLDTNGDYVWAKKVGGTSADVGQSITVDSSGNSYSTGLFSDTADFDPGAGTANLISAGSEEVFILKLDTDGNYVWAKKFGSTGFDSSYGIDIDSTGASYTTGYFNDTVDFDPSSGTAELTSIDGTEDVFILKLDTDGNYVWAKKVGGTSADIGQSITVDSVGGVYTVGHFYNTADFDPSSTGTAELTPSGSSDIFILRLNDLFSTVTYNGNDAGGGNIPIDGLNPYSNGSSVTVLGNMGSLTRGGDIFTNWNTEVDGTGSSYAENDVFTITEDMTLYAQWAPKPASGFGIRFCDPENGITTFCRWRTNENSITSCTTPIYLVREVKYGASNNPEDVKLLEKFLNTYENANLPVDGFYSLADKNVVIQWQEKHYEDVLKPWGITKGTGYVYIKSLAKIKEIHEALCSGL